MIRLLTSCLVVIAGLAVGLTGGNIVQFVDHRTEKEADAVQSWIGTPGLTTFALAGRLHVTVVRPEAGTPSARAAILTQLLSVRPLSSADWLSLAGIGLVAGNPRQTAFAALEMSSLTGPNEGAVMWERGVFGLLQWEALPEAARTRTGIDLAGPIRERLVEDSDIALFKSILAPKPPKTRSDIATRMAAQGVSPAALARMGL